MAFAMIPTDRQTGEGSQRANADICGLKIQPVGRRLVPTQKRGDHYKGACFLFPKGVFNSKVS